MEYLKYIECNDKRNAQNFLIEASLGLWHANKAIRNYTISQVVLHGDFTDENRQQRGRESNQNPSKFSK
ncbi:unnamed protein product [Blepharisma stoltei]|uniref:Uncharacterized protein n=1 Tax=Blepharisma stoltei TaxID=1481888 RepID=A0AAU9IQF7_9CILI|nr:unnamed protein product [Blepharisma stoltei]